MKSPRLYTATPVVLDRFESLWTAPRPLPGRRIGWRSGSGFPVYAIHDDNINAAIRDGAEPIERHDEQWEKDIVTAHEYADAYRELIDSGDMTVRRVVTDSGAFAHIPIDLDPKGTP